jgi:hypothetical protein
MPADPIQKSLPTLFTKFRWISVARAVKMCASVVDLEKNVLKNGYLRPKIGPYAATNESSEVS